MARRADKLDEPLVVEIEDEITTLGDGPFYLAEPAALMLAEVRAEAAYTRARCVSRTVC
jgi:hypothetical protein